MPYKRGNKWLGQVMKKGKKKYKTCQSKKEAIAWEVEQKSKIEIKEIVTISLLQWAESYLDFVEVKFSTKTYKEKSTVFRRLFAMICPDLTPQTITPGMMLEFLQYQAKGRTGNAANKDRKNLIAAWNWGIKYMALPSPNPCLVDRFPESKKVRYVPSQKDFWKVFAQAGSEQDQVMLLAYLHLAARRSELFGLRWSDIDFKDSKVRLFTRKRKDSSLEFDWLPLTEDLHSSLIELEKNKETVWVFPDPRTKQPYMFRQKWMGELCDKAGVKKFGLHSIRHLTASILAQQNVSMIDIQAILRHKNLSTTERYIRRLSALRPALRLLPGKICLQKQKKAYSDEQALKSLTAANS